MYASCWHEMEHESALMWKSYAEHEIGVAVKSCGSRLRAAFADARQDLFLGRVRYRDYETEMLDETNKFHLHYSKRRFFETEHEVRLMYWARLKDLRPGHPHPLGMEIPVDIGALIETVHLRPSAEDWEYHAIHSVIKKLGYLFPVKRSQI